MKRMTIIGLVIILIGVIVLSLYNISGNTLNTAYDVSGNTLPVAYDKSGEEVFPDYPILPVPTGDLTAASTVVLPDIYNNGHGWTCTGLAYDADSDTFLVGDIGKALPSSPGFASQIVKMSSDFTTVKGTIPLYTSFTSMQDIQGITIDMTDGTIWFCSTSENLIRHINSDGTSIGSFSVSGSPTGIAYSPKDDSLWVLTYADSNNIQRISKTGTVLEQYTFSYSDTLDQCFLDPERGYLYITAGANYSSRNNVYLFNTSTHAQSITCTVDSHSVEGIWIGETEMVIVNDGYYHSAYDNRNVANIYDLS
jgi:Gluconolactonase